MLLIRILLWSIGDIAQEKRAEREQQKDNDPICIDCFNITTNCVKNDSCWNQLDYVLDISPYPSCDQSDDEVVPNPPCNNC